MRRYDFTVEAAEDLRKIARYTRDKWGVEQARRYRQELELSIQRLSVHSGLGVARDEIAVGLRSFRVASHVAFYLPRSDGITIVRLLHPRIDVDRAFESGASGDGEREP